MENDLQHFRSAYLKLQKDMERLSRLANPSYLHIYEQMERMLEPIRQHHLEIMRAVELSGHASSRLAEISHANKHWQYLIDYTTVTSRVIEDFKRTHQTWLNALKPMQDNIAQIQAAAKLSLCEMTRCLTVAERFFARIDFESLNRAAAFSKPVITDLERVILGVKSTYKNLADSISTLPEVTRLPAFALPGATREVFTTGYALDVFCTPDKSQTEEDLTEIQLIAEVEQETSGCIALLQRVDPALVRPYIGARDALRSTSTDRARHILASLREFWNHLLRRLAPDELVMKWLPKDAKDLLYDGRPTRKARILYVCRNLYHSQLIDFVDQDTRALIKLIEFFNHVHKLELELTDEQLRALLLKTDSWLMYILQIWKGA